MRRRWLRMLAAAAAPIVALALPSAPAQATPGCWCTPAWRFVRAPTSARSATSTPTADRVHRGPLQGQRAGHRQGRQPDRHPGVVPRQHPERRHRRHQPSDRRLGGDQPRARRRGQQHPAGRAAADRRPGHRARRRSAGVSLRCDHRGELRNHRGGSTTGGSRWPTAWSARRVTPADRCTTSPRTAGRHRRDVQQHLGSLSGGGVVAGRQPTGSRRRHLRRSATSTPHRPRPSGELEHRDRRCGSPQLVVGRLAASDRRRVL